MATRSTISVEQADGSVVGVYCHWDGYLSHNGKILEMSYNNSAKAQALIETGDISSLGNTLEETDFYSRETRAAPYGWNDYRAWHAEMRRGDKAEEFNYLRRKNGVWYVSAYGKHAVPLRLAIEQNTLAA
jgi:hypothetical protein